MHASFVLGFLCLPIHPMQPGSGQIHESKSSVTFQGPILPGLISVSELESAKVADFGGDCHESLVFKSSATFRIFSFGDSGIELSQEFPYHRNSSQRNERWAVGDLNADGKDEILYPGPNGFKYSQAMGKQFKFLDLPFSEIPDQFLIGDFGWWGMKNLVIFSHTPSDIREEIPNYNYRLGLYYFSTDYSTGIYHQWCEHHAFKYSFPKTIPPDQLQSVGPIDISTIPFLIVALA